MLRPRLIPVLFLMDGFLVRSENFRIHQRLGNPIAQVDRYNAWDVDELIYIDITREAAYGKQRTDLGGMGGAHPTTPEEVIALVAKHCFMPLTFGGGIRSIEHIERRLGLGADKITLNTQALQDPEFITSAARRFGSQAIIVSIDVIEHSDGRSEVFGKNGTWPTGRDPVEWAVEAERRGAGEILLNSVDRDGTARGYDLKLIRNVAQATTIPTIAVGGVGEYSDFGRAITDGGAAAAAAGNIFHFRELAYPLAKQQLKKRGIPFR